MYPNCVVFSPDGKRLAVGGSNIRLWEVATGEEVRPRGDESFVIVGADFSPDGRLLATGGADGFIRLWQADTGAEVRHFQGGASAYPALWFSPDSKSLFLNSRSEIVQKDAESGEQKQRFSAPEFLAPFTVSTSGELFAWADRNQTVYVKDLSSGEELRRWRRKDISEQSRYLRFSPGGELLASIDGFGRLHKVFNVKTGDILPPLKDQWAFAGFSLGGRVVARTDLDGRIYFHETATGKELARTGAVDERLRLFLDRQRLFPSVFSPDGKTLAASIDSETIRLWETATGQERHRLPGHEGWGMHMVFSPDGGKLATVGTENTALVWQVFGLQPGQRPLELSDRQLLALWADLASGDAPTAFRAIRTLIASPSSALDLLRRQVRPVPRVDPRQLARWIADLDTDSLAIREKAATELAKLGRAAEKPLRKALKEHPTLEARRRLEALFDELESPAIPAKFLGTYRALEVLEHLTTPEAGRLLEELAHGEPAARLTREAKASLARRSRHHPPKP